MLSAILHILLDAVILMIAAKFLNKVHLKGFKTALIVALLIGVLSFFLSWLLTAVLNIATLGIFYFLGLGFITRMVAYAIIIEIADQISSDFKTEGFLPSLWLAVILALFGSILDAMIF
ncbi:phage holin family protein [Zunongwangia endophytica]|uniref:Phage holin family protein n=1 Tax=Zunongwangia endophytica TaxID=1808945 RepID=A0ABV8HDF9_9FLAO|nr:phage holin family protein [Zunongwangia endophytica]MDN3593534.1 phage holin family protein [Zunongwangia endophytica]